MTSAKSLCSLDLCMSGEDGVLSVCLETAFATRHGVTGGMEE